MASLFTPHPLALQTAYSELKRQASEQTRFFAGSPGSVGERAVRGGRFLYRQFYDAEGGKRAEYLGAVDDPDAMARARTLREQIEAANALTVQARLLARQGYIRADSRTTAVVSALCSHGVFRAGAVMVGSHAYGVLLNELAVRAAAFHTADVDIARGARLELPSGIVSFERMLADSTLQLTPVHGFDRKAAPTSYRSPGRDGLRVDLLMPTRGDEISVRRVPELDAHATALPHLGYLVEAPIDAILIGRDSVLPVRAPRPERFAWHKVLVSQLRSETSDKRGKDLQQAAVLFAALAEAEPESLREALAEAPAKKKLLSAARKLLELLEKTPHVRATELLRELL